MKQNLAISLAVALVATLARAGDGTVKVESPGRKPSETWLARDTRLLELLDGYVPSGPVETGTYGGWLAHHDAAKGYFYAKKIRGRWWLIDPEGYYYINRAINMINAPSEEILAKFGSTEDWVNATSDLFKSNHFNGTGGWTSSAVGEHAPGLSRTITMNFMSEFAKEKGLRYEFDHAMQFTNDCIPVFNPDFPAFCDAYAARLAETRTDPWILGIFSDNELPYSRDLLDRYLLLDEGNPHLKPNRDAARAWLRANVGGDDTSKITDTQRQQFEAYVFEHYYKTVTAAIRKYDPNHLYLGSRLLALVGHIGTNQFFWTMVGKHVDVIAINYYDVWGPKLSDVSNWERWSSKPLLVTEFYTKAMDVPKLANTGGAGWVVRTQEDRARFYQHFALGCLESGNIVGWHWFTYRDEPVTATKRDSAGGANKGFVSYDFRPYSTLLARAAAVNREAYSLTTFFDRRQLPAQANAGKK